MQDIQFCDIRKRNNESVKIISSCDGNSQLIRKMHKYCAWVTVVRHRIAKFLIGGIDRSNIIVNTQRQATIWYSDITNRSYTNLWASDHTRFISNTILSLSTPLSKNNLLYLMVSSIILENRMQWLFSKTDKIRNAMKLVITGVRFNTFLRYIKKSLSRAFNKIYKFWKANRVGWPWKFSAP